MPSWPCQGAMRTTQPMMHWMHSMHPRTVWLLGNHTLWHICETFYRGTCLENTRIGAQKENQELWPRFVCTHNSARKVNVPKHLSSGLFLMIRSLLLYLFHSAVLDTYLRFMLFGWCLNLFHIWNSWMLFSINRLPSMYSGRECNHQSRTAGVNYYIREYAIKFQTWG